jgi:hypothetical protein
MGKCEVPVIPTVYLLGIKNKACPPLNFFTNEHINIVNYSPQEVHVKLARPWGADDPSSEKIPLLDMPKMVSLWGSDDIHSCLTPLRYIEASANFLHALELLSITPNDSDSTSTSYAAEFKQHRDFFLQQHDFEATYQYRYSFELESCHDIMKGVLFDWSVYALRVEVLTHARDLLEHLASAPGCKRPGDWDMPSTKESKHSLLTDVSSTRISSRSSFPTCFLCGKDYRYRDHPSSLTSFEDGQPLFWHLTDTGVKTISSFKGGSPKQICAVWNISRSCNGQHGGDRLHFCSLCGGNHSALERNLLCARITDGQIFV